MIATLLALACAGPPLLTRSIDELDEGSAGEGDSVARDSATDTGDAVDASDTSDTSSTHDPSDPTEDTSPPPPADADGDGFVVGVDCDDANAAVFPGAPEACDGVDDDCDGVLDPATPPACPAPGAMSLVEGGGLVPIDASGFVLADEGSGSAKYALIAALERTLAVVSPGAVFVDGNRDADVISGVDNATGFAWGFDWNSGDDSVDYWMPQGITGTFDADPSGLVEGRAGVLVSWHYEPDEAGTSYDKGVRVSFADVSDRGRVTYRHALLVDPVGTTSAPDLAAVTVHAGGIAWVGPWLYVVDTSNGIRVFDMRHILQVSTDVDELGCTAAGVCRAWNYKYVIPQVTRWALPACGCDATFSFVGLDRSSSPPSLVTGAYSRDSIDGVLLRWPLDPATLLPAGTYVRASEAWVAQQDRMQGAASIGGVWWLASSSQSGSYGRLYRARSGSRSTGYDWVYGAEDLAVDAGNGWMWTCTEHPDDRAVFASRLSAVGG